jgi:hypothetical protein
MIAAPWTVSTCRFEKCRRISSGEPEVKMAVSEKKDEAGAAEIDAGSAAARPRRKRESIFSGRGKAKARKQRGGAARPEESC